MKNRKIIINIFAATTFLLISALYTGCYKGPNKSWQALIGDESEGIMELYTIANETESLLLRSVSLELSEKQIRSKRLETLKKRMLSTVNDTLNQGVGIAAPQVGIPLRLIAVQRFDKQGEPFEFYINPEITFYSESMREGPEGCLSIPTCRGQVFRSSDITVKYLDETTLKPKEEHISGFTAAIFQHEIDHLDGILYADIASSLYCTDEY